MKRVKTADIWVSDVYLQRGLETLLDKSFSAPARKRFVFFTIENYYAVKAQNYDLSTHRLVLLTQGDMYYFLSDFKMFRLNARSDLSTLQRSIKDIASDGEKVRKRTEKIVLTDRDKVFIDQFSSGKSVQEIAMLNKLHYKTVYQNRQKLITKLGCTNLVNFFTTLKSDVFKRWVVSA